LDESTAMAVGARRGMVTSSAMCRGFSPGRNDQMEGRPLESVRARYREPSAATAPSSIDSPLMRPVGPVSETVVIDPRPGPTYRAGAASPLESEQFARASTAARANAKRRMA
jgi:hypothetical protein